ncbi:hypothetical protein ACGFNU_01850 [Spirillospora sp. NPDC048911]|uniref:hypothetical protein n=1 Tax=Spirillospora sp. NPDC048911 TaxID=3364527 RepID=UPI003713627F
MSVRVLGLTSGVTPEDHRLGLAAFLPPQSGALERRSGVVYHPGACDLVRTGPMTATLSPFLVLVDGTSARTQGAYPVVSDAAVTISFDPGEAITDRVDRVIVRVRDDPYDASGVQAGGVEYLRGRPTGMPAELPPSALLLWEVTVKAGASRAVTVGGTLTDLVRRHPYTTGLGAPIPVAGRAERDALPALDTLSVLRLDTGDIEWRWRGAWRRLDWRLDTGWVDIPAVLTDWQIQTTPRVRRIGPLVELRGRVLRTRSNYQTRDILQLPAGFRADGFHWVAPYYPPKNGLVHLGSYDNGSVGVAREDVDSNTAIPLDTRWMAL